MLMSLKIFSSLPLWPSFSDKANCSVGGGATRSRAVYRLWTGSPSRSSGHGYQTCRASPDTTTAKVFFCRQRPSRSWGRLQVPGFFGGYSWLMPRQHRLRGERSGPVSIHRHLLAGRLLGGRRRRVHGEQAGAHTMAGALSRLGARCL